MKLRIAIAVMAVALVSGATPVSAHAGVFAINGRMDVSGLWAPIGLCAVGSPPPLGEVCPPAANGWEITSGTTGTGSHEITPEVVEVIGSGTLLGRCGSSSGEGILVIDGITAPLALFVAFSWTGTTIVLTGSDGGHTVDAILTAVPTVGNCVTNPASRFLITGTALLS